MDIDEVLEYARIDFGSSIVGVEPVMEWNGLCVYMPVFTGCPCLGTPFYYIEKDGSVRISEPDEGWSIYRELVRTSDPDEEDEYTSSDYIQTVL